MKIEKALVFNDLHIPWHDETAVELMLTTADIFKPDIIFIDGDLVDAFEISSFTQSPKLLEKGKLVSELGIAKQFLVDLRLRFKKARIVYIYGNHSFRWEVYLIKNAKPLYGLPGMTLAEQLNLDKLNIEVVYKNKKENSYLWGKLLIGHMDRVCAAGGMTAKNLIESKCISIIQGHTHRGGSSFKRLYDRDIVGYENFCLCTLDPDYVDRPNWQNGYSVVYKDAQSDHFFVSQHPITRIAEKNHVEYKTFFNGKCFSKKVNLKE